MRTVFLGDGWRYVVPTGPGREPRLSGQVDRGFRLLALDTDGDNLHGPEDRDRFGDLA